MKVLSKEDKMFWDENGYVVINKAVPPENIKATVGAIWDFLEMEPNSPESWYPHPPRPGIGVKLYHHQTVWENRQYPRVYQAFSEIWGTEKLWVSFDQVSMSPPDRTTSGLSDKLYMEDSSKQPIPMHWDIPLERPLPFAVQGALYLTDTTEEMGAFTCVPGFHHKTEAWLKNLSPNVNPRKENLMSFGVKPIPGKAGDLIIWQGTLPHGAGQNIAHHPRLVQYISMFPEKVDDEDTRNYRINAWRNRLVGGGAWGVMHELPFGKKVELHEEKEHALGQTAVLSSLGRKLLGLDRWER